MPKKIKIGLLAILFAVVVALVAIYLHHQNVQLLNTKGIVGDRERNLMYFALLLSVIVVVPVFTLTALFAWRYRAGNKKATYSPNLGGSRVAEAVWWLIPLVLITILSVVTWRSSHELDPYKPLASSKKPLTIQVVAMNWKWLFIYPEQNIASVNFVEFPANTPVTFNITADAPMNSFWIPQLGGQVYAMPGMNTQLHLMAAQNGNYPGSSANISGTGFAGMRFTAKAASQSDFTAWVQAAQRSPSALTVAAYNQLAKPSQNNPASFYSSVATSLYDTILMKYMMPMGPGTDNSSAPGIPITHSMGI